MSSEAVVQPPECEGGSRGCAGAFSPSDPPGAYGLLFDLLLELRRISPR